MSGHPALARLGRLKLKGALRRQLRRMKTPKGAIFTLIGVAIFALWAVNLAVVFLADRPPIDRETLPQRVAIGASFLVLLSVSGAFSHRGLFLPPDEIERLLAAPVTRGDLVRYRLRAAMLRNVLAGVLVGMMVMHRMPRPGYAFLGTLLSMVTLPVLQQFLAILLGGVEHRLGRLLARVGRVLWPLAFFTLVAMIAVAALGEGGDRLQDTLVEAFDEDPLRHPALVALSRVFLPWANLLSATSLESFALWCGVCTAILFALYEATARLRVDFRELSLATSASVAARIRRARRGGGVAASRVSRFGAARRVPWLFGRGPGGAVAWRKSASIVRKARGTFGMSVLVLAFVTFLTVTVADGADPWTGSLLIAVFGTVYLCAGLRFDFREELDRMEVVKAWPVRPAKLFLYTLLPEVVLVSALVAVAVLVRAVLEGGLDAPTLCILGAVPLVVCGWVALDNAIFLVAPVRMVPGQEGALQNAGRGIVLLFARMVAFLLVGSVAGLAAWLGHEGARTLLLLSSGQSLAVGALTLLSVLLAADAALVWLGGRALARFDVAADR